MVFIILLLKITFTTYVSNVKKGCVHTYTGPHPSLPNNPDHISPQIIQEILKTCGEDLANFECYKHCKARNQTTKV